MKKKNKRINVEILVSSNKVLNWLNIITKNKDLQKIDFKFTRSSQIYSKDLGAYYYSNKVKNLYKKSNFKTKLLKIKEQKISNIHNSTDIIISNNGFEIPEKKRARKFLLWFPKNTVSFDKSNIYQDSISSSYVLGRKLSNIKLFKTSKKFKKISCFRNLTVINDDALYYSHETYYSKIIVLIVDLFKKLLEFGFNNFESNLIDIKKIQSGNINPINNFDSFNVIRSFKRITNSKKHIITSGNWKIKIKKIDEKKNCLYKKTTSFSKDSLIDVLDNQNFSVADPFLFKNSKETWLFFEKISNDGKGSIFAKNLDSKDNRNHAIKIFNKSYHMSFPNIFSYNGEIFMIPETAQLKKINLYKCQKFPNKWVKVKTLLDNLYATDTVIFFWDNYFWMFTEIRSDNSFYSDFIYLFWSKSLTGKWVEHPMNPIVNNPNNSRSAGQIFLDKDEIIRPSQSSINGYGSSIRFMKILELSKKYYLEKNYSNLNPEDLSVNKVHTYSKSENYEAIDLFI